MKYFFLLSKLNVKLSRLELYSLLEIYNVKFKKILEKDNIIIIETKSNKIEELCERSSLIKSSSEIIEKTPVNLGELSKKFSKISWNKWVKAPFKLRIRDLIRAYVKEVTPLEKNLAKYIWKSINNPSVNLKNPKTTIYVFLTNQNFYITKLIWEVKSHRFRDREPKSKPAFHPTILRPWLARLLVNLARTKKELLDPFCGTGSVLIEAALIGAKVTGSDLDTRMLKRAKKNLDFYKLKAELDKIDATKLSQHFKKAKSIATDPPYRRSSFSSKEDISELYNIFLKEVGKILQGYISLMIPKGIKINIPESLETVGKADLYVHGSLTRRILILKTKYF
ncbi:MAG: RsmD family RNA methyltransferase [Candidatus Woesearchaeota archaeon]|nr:MAG: RsmD family RNA methyltransferase [Candidatus Woesearchaeota archaeon]